MRGGINQRNKKLILTKLKVGPRVAATSMKSGGNEKTSKVIKKKVSHHHPSIWSSQKSWMMFRNADQSESESGAH